MLRAILFLFFTLAISGCDFFHKKISDNSNFEWLDKSSFISAPVTQAELKNRIVLINFWASWCAPCQEETPALLKIVQAHPNDITLISINSEADLKEAKKFIRLFPNFKGSNIFILHDANRNWSNAYSVTGLPETFIFDRQMKLVHKVKGLINFSSADFKNEINKLLVTKKID